MCKSPARAAAILVTAAFCLSFTLAKGATPASGTVTPAAGTLSFTGGPFDNVNPTGDPPPAPPVSPVCSSNVLPCDDFALTVTIQQGDTNVYFLKVNLTFANLDSDFDLYLLDSEGNVVAASINSTGVQEAVRVGAHPGTVEYTVRVVPFDVVTGSGGDTYAALVTLSQLVAPPDPPEIPTVPGVARFKSHAAPTGAGEDAAEPSIGADWATDKAMFQAGLRTYRVSFDDCASPADVTWQDVTFPTTSQASLDPILFTDSRTNRTFVSQLTGACSAAAFTDDDGDNYTPSEGCGTPAGVDHQSFGGGPFAPGGALGPLTEYPNAVYYCSQESVTAFCALSQDGGLTFNTAVPAWNLTQCSAIHGHIKVAADGTVYVPNKDCGDPATQAVIVSGDNGLTWTVRPVAGSTTTKLGYLVDPSVGIGSEGRLYFGYQGSDGHPYVAVSDDQGLTWRNNQDVGLALGIENCTFPEVVAGHNDRAAFAFLGTLTSGDYGNDADFNALWHVYVSTTYDGGVTWTTVDATPHDPVQRGSICNKGTTACDNVPDDRNLLDFNDITIDRFGRILVAYADGCITNSCIYGSANDFTAKATIARQSGGRGLFPQYDPIPQEPNAPPAPRLGARRVAPGVVNVSWSTPDNGGAPVTGYSIYRGVTSGGEAFLISVGARNSYLDITADPATAYYYRITAVNSAGEGTFCSEAFVPAGVEPGVDPCTVPGVTIAVDSSDDPPNVPPTPAIDIQSVSVGEPYGTDGSSKMVFTLQVGEATSAPPSSQWYVLWNRTSPDAGADRNYVAMKTDAAGAASFEHGTIAPPNANLPTRVGAAADGSYNPGTGTIRITISNGLVDGVVAGQTLTTMQARAFFSRPDGLPVTQTASNDFSAIGAYTLVGNPSCRSNAPPNAALTRTPVDGCVPLMVTLDGSSSSDPDAGDTIASYQFDFGDGAPSVIQSSPVTTHTYAAAGDYGARLHVTDSRGKISQNVDLEVIGVEPLPTAVASGSATICSGSSASLHGFGGTSCQWSPATGLSDPSSCDPISSPAQTTTYTLTVASAGGCASTNMAAVTVTLEPCAVAEVTPLLWTQATKDTLAWPAVENATSYRLFRGALPDLPSLLDAGIDSCLRFEGAATTTGPVLTEVPAVSDALWYLVAAVNQTNQGPAGNATAGPRIVNSGGPCP